MIRYLAKRLGIASFLILVVSILVFVLMRGLPGDPALIALGDSASADAIEAYRNRMGLNDPLILQYLRWISGIVLQWNFGKSVLNEQNVSAMISQRLPTTLTIGIPSIVLGIILGLPIGIVSAITRGRWIDQILTFVVNAFLGTPRFLVAIFGVFILAFKFRLIPLQGYTAPWVDFAAYLHKAIWPIFINSIYVFAVLARYMRSSLLEVMTQDYIRTARANGLSESRVIFRHALKNSLIPVVTIIGLQMPQIIAGAVIIESIFNIPGVGQLVLNGILNRDYLVVQAATLVIALVTIMSNLLVDMSYALIDPRIKRLSR
ncbi:ABC transporter permease [Agrobacterium sp. SORGH_AS 787]|uniref:ABC transporter permease n=1 Tax=Agrobacterium sp. SORGH_AS 787 TaxID=3041775 RepID=UPI002781B160|nr:peptide/nickel transport system permease protein [Rhizobium sp. SORGH_AS_0787]